MNVKDLADPETIRNLVSLFLIGYVYRFVEGAVRDRRKDTELTTIVLAVVWSAVLYSGLKPLSVYILANVPPSVDLAATLAYYVGSAALIGWLVGSLRMWLPKRLRWMKPGHVQVAPWFLQSSEGSYVEVGLRDGSWLLGVVHLRDRDPDRVESLHLTLRHPAKRGTDGWEMMTNVEEIFLSLKDVVMIVRLKSGGGQ